MSLYPKWYSPVIIADITLLCYFQLKILDVTQLVIYNMLIFIWVVVSYLRQLNNRYVTEPILSEYSLNEYTKLSFIILKCNREVWSKFLFIIVPLQLFSIIIMSFRILVTGIMGVLPNLFWTIFFVLTILCQVAQIPYQIHQRGRLHLARKMMELYGGGCGVRMKLKCLTLFERVQNTDNNNGYYSLSIGSICPITYSVIGQVSVFTYLNYY